MQALWKNKYWLNLWKGTVILTKQEMDKLRFCEAPDRYTQHLTDFWVTCDTFASLNIPIKF